jgi:hypothetical protein
LRAEIVGFHVHSGGSPGVVRAGGNESGDGGGDLLSAGSRPDQLDLADGGQPLEAIFEDPNVRKLGHDLIAGNILLARHGVTLRGVEFDADARQLPARREPIEPRAAGDCARAPRLQGDRSGALAGKGVKAVPLSRLAPEAC